MSLFVETKYKCKFCNKILTLEKDYMLAINFKKTHSNVTTYCRLSICYFMTNYVLEDGDIPCCSSKECLSYAHFKYNFDILE